MKLQMSYLNTLTGENIKTLAEMGGIPLINIALSADRKICECSRLLGRINRLNESWSEDIEKMVDTLNEEMVDAKDVLTKITPHLPERPTRSYTKAALKRYLNNRGV